VKKNNKNARKESRPITLFSKNIKQIAAMVCISLLSTESQGSRRILVHSAIMQCMMLCILSVVKKSSY